MAKIDNKRIIKRANEINSGWKQDAVAKDVKFMNISQGEYQADLDAADAKLQEINDALAHVEDLRGEYTDICQGINTKSVKVREGVEGNPDYGNDSPLYGAMKYKRKSERASGLTKKKKDDQNKDK